MLIPGGGTRALVLARIAVPMFFVIGSYFFFQKIQKSNNRTETIMFYIFRLLKLYIGWFIILLPITLKIRNYFVNGIVDGLKRIFFGFIFGSTFVASWYIMATILGTLLVYMLTKYFGNTMTLITGIIFYLISCVATNYYNVLSVVCLDDLLKYYPGNFYNSFPVAVIWIVIGKLFAENKIQIKRKFNLFYLGVSIILLEVEGIVVRGISYTDDCYIMLIPVSIFLFSILISCTKEILIVRQLRCFGTITFCSHASLKRIINVPLKRAFDTNVFPGACILFMLTIAACIVLTFVIRKLEKRKYFKWIKVLS